MTVPVLSQSCSTPCDPMDRAPLSMGFPRQIHGSGLPFPSSGDPPNPGIEPVSPAWQVNSLPLSHRGNKHLVIKPSWLGKQVSSCVPQTHSWVCRGNPRGRHLPGKPLSVDTDAGRGFPYTIRGLSTETLPHRLTVTP